MNNVSSVNSVVSAVSSVSEDATEKATRKRGASLKDLLAMRATLDDDAFIQGLKAKGPKPALLRKVFKELSSGGRDTGALLSYMDSIGEPSKVSRGKRRPPEAGDDKLFQVQEVNGQRFIRLPIPFAVELAEPVRKERSGEEYLQRYAPVRVVFSADKIVVTKS